MKAKGIYRDGPKKGELIELSAEEKVPLALQDALVECDEYKDKFAVWATHQQLKKVRFVSNGKPLESRWQNNRYFAEGQVTVNRRKLDPDRLLAPQTKSFILEFEDCLDHIGQPDTKILTFKLE
jgi:hypothetical protein